MHGEEGNGALRYIEHGETNSLLRCSRIVFSTLALLDPSGFSSTGNTLIYYITTITFQLYQMIQRMLLVSQLAQPPGTYLPTVVPLDLISTIRYTVL